MPKTLKSLLNIVGTDRRKVYFVFDGAFGNNDALQMVRQCHLHLISKLRFDAALYLPYAGWRVVVGGAGNIAKNYKQLPERAIPQKFQG